MRGTVRERTVELSSPLSTARGRIDTRHVFLIRIERDGVVGLGEATPLPGWTESVEECRAALEETVTAIEENPAGAMSHLEDCPAARHGINLAATDRAARAADEPLYRHLGRSDACERVPVNATLGDAGREETATAAAKAVEAGFETVKVKVGARPVAEDVARVRAVREAVGDDVVVRADANAAWSMDEARTAFDQFRALRVSYVEQPLAADDLDGLRSLRGNGVGVAVDETLTEYDVETVFEARAADAVVIKPMVVGGPRRAVQMARQAIANGVDPVFTTTVDAAVARTGAVHCAAVFPTIGACGLATGGRLATDPGSDPSPVEDGSVPVPQHPGLADRATLDRWWSS